MSSKATVRREHPDRAAYQAGRLIRNRKPATVSPNVSSVARPTGVLDPVDGTKAFMAGLPVYGTLIGLARGGHPVLGIIDQPVARERWTGMDGDGTWYNGERVHAEACDRLSDALVCTTSAEYYEGDDTKLPCNASFPARDG